MKAQDVVNSLLEAAPPRRKKLFNGAVIEHPYFGRLTIRSEDLDRVPAQSHWQAFKEDGTPATPLYYSERKLHWALKWYARHHKPPYQFV